ncbi:hypothetical protein, partial [Klebsiella aerogenes]
DSIARRIAAGQVRTVPGAPAEVLYDLAGPVLEVMRGGRAGEANTLANRYLDIAPQGATGWSLLPLYLS